MNTTQRVTEDNDTTRSVTEDCEHHPESDGGRILFPISSPHPHTPSPHPPPLSPIHLPPHFITYPPVTQPDAYVRLRYERLLLARSPVDPSCRQPGANDGADVLRGQRSASPCLLCLTEGGADRRRYEAERRRDAEGHHGRVRCQPHGHPLIIIITITLL
ncbi:unnamed protein product [Arctogadus glacialis]